MYQSSPSSPFVEVVYEKEGFLYKKEGVSQCIYIPNDMHTVFSNLFQCTRCLFEHAAYFVHAVH